MRVLMNHQGNLGYGPDQINNPITLNDLLEQIEEAIAEWGGDAEVVAYQTNNGHGANYGSMYRHELFEAVDGACEECTGSVTCECDECVELDGRG
jgi:hypothetical protein